MPYEPPKHIQIKAELFFALYALICDLAAGKLDEFDAQDEAQEILPDLTEKYNAMVSRYEYYQTHIAKEKENG